MVKQLQFPLVKTEETLFCDLRKVHHLFISGCSASGKSVFLHKIIKYFLDKNVDEVKLMKMKS